MRENRKAFTIVELLVAIVIIGILGTLAIVAYSSVISRTYVSAVTSDLVANDKKAKAYLAQYGSFPTSVDTNYCPSAPIADKNYCFQKSSVTAFVQYIGAASTYTLAMGPSDGSNTKKTYVISPTTSPTPTAISTFALKLDNNNSTGACYDISSCSDFGNQVISTSDGGLAIAGGVDFGDSLANPVCQIGGCSNVGVALIAKFDSGGNLSWAKGWDNGNSSPQTGASQPDEANSVIELSDKSYVMAGYTRTSGISNDDAILVKINTSGSHLWTTRWYGSSSDQANQVIFTPSDNGFLMVGDTSSYGSGGQDAFIAKFDSSGSIAGGWSRTIGSASTDTGKSVVAVSDGYVLIGETNNTPYIAKYNLNGAYQWSNTWPATGSVSSIISTTDGGFAVSGTTSAYGTGGDAYIAKFTSAGVLSWLRIWGGTGSETGASLKQTADGGYIMAGSTTSYGNGGQDAFIAKFDTSGALSWSKTIGNTNTDYASSITITSDGGYALVGSIYDTKYKVLLARSDPGGTIFNCNSSLCKDVSASSSSPSVSSSTGTLSSTSPSATATTITSPTYLTLNPIITYLAQ